MGVWTYNTVHTPSWNIHPRKFYASQQWTNEVLTGKAPTWRKLASCEGCSFFKDKGIKVVEVVTDANVQIASVMSMSIVI